MAEHKLIRCEANDPDRCDSVSDTFGQCPYRRWEPSKYCGRHGANVEVQKEEKKVQRNYQLAKWQSRVNDFADNDKVKSLREEIGILRICLEETVNKCSDASEILMMSHKISDLVIKIEKLVSSCHRLEQSTGQLLDKSAALTFAGQIVVIVSNYVKEPSTIDLITNDILKSLTTLTPDVTTNAPVSSVNGNQNY